MRLPRGTQTLKKGKDETMLGTNPFYKVNLVTFPRDSCVQIMPTLSHEL